MKNLGRILSLTLILIIMSISVAFAGTLEIVNTYPEDGAKNVSLENMGVKIYTNSVFTSEKLGTVNDSAFQIYGPDGSKVPTKVYYSTKDPDMILVLADKDEEGKIFAAVSDSDYRLEIESTLQDDMANSLGKKIVINLHTVNQKRNNTINTVMMLGLFGIIMVVSMRSAKKAAQKEGAQKKQDNTVNPYKEAKKTGKSVSEIVEKDKANKAKAAEKAAKEAEKKAKREAELEEEEELEEGHYRVKTRRSALAVGSKYATAKKAKHDARREQEAKWAAQAKKKSKKK